MAAIICANPLQCNAIHQIRAEMAEMNIKLATVYSNVQLLLEASRINRPPVLTSADLNKVPQINGPPLVTPSMELNQVPQINGPPVLSPSADLTQPSSIALADSPTIPHSCEVSSMSNSSELNTKEEKMRENNVECGISSIKEEMVDNEVSSQIAENCSSSSSKDTKDIEEVMDSSEFDSKSQHQKVPNYLCEVKKDHAYGSAHLQRRVSEDGRPSLYVRMKATVPSRRLHKEIPRRVRVTDYYCKECQKNISTDWRSHVTSVHLQKCTVMCALCGYSSKSWLLEEIQDHFIHIHPNKSFQVTDVRKELVEEISKLGNEIIQKQCVKRRRTKPPENHNVEPNTRRMRQIDIFI